MRQVATIKVGISSDKAREINKLIKEKGPKGVSSQTQGESVRVTSKKRDDLQAVMQAHPGGRPRHPDPVRQPSRLTSRLRGTATAYGGAMGCGCLIVLLGRRSRGSPSS